MGHLEEMRSFVRVVEAGSISGAAAQMQLAKSAVSRRLKDLEDRLGAQLIARTTRSLGLTDAGRDFYERSLQIIADVSEAEGSVARDTAELRGKLRVAAPLSFGLLHLGPAINEFIDDHPELSFDIDFDDRQVDIVEESFDLAVRIGQLSDSTLMARRLTPIRTVVCASPGYWTEHGLPDRPADLQSHDGLHYSNAAWLNWPYTTSAGQKGKVRLPVRMQANNGDYLRDAAICGKGVALLPTFIVYKAIEERLLVPALTDCTWSVLSAYAVYPSTRHLSQRVRTLIDFLVARFGDQPYWDDCLDR
ncbi:MAG: LysR family transcriptional regulator [Gammaproteobacteria bacterium]|nr:LysR family transcriptional regulator [Gammaproteobacteria bacterium]